MWAKKWDLEPSGRKSPSNRPSCTSIGRPKEDRMLWSAIGRECSHRRPKLALWIYYEIFVTRCEYITKSQNYKSEFKGTQQLQFICQEFETKTIHLVCMLYLLLLRCFLGWFWSELVEFEVSLFTIYSRRFPCDQSRKRPALLSYDHPCETPFEMSLKLFNKKLS